MLRRTAFLILGLCALTIADSWSFYGGPWCAKRLTDLAVGMVGNTPVIYGVNQDYSLVKSTDEGQSWTVLMSGLHIRCVACNPGNADEVYVGLQSGDGGIKYSTDGGNTWTSLNSGLPATFVPSAIAMRDAQHIVLGLDPLNANDHTIYYWNVTQWSQSTFPNPNYKGFRVTDLKWDPRSGLEEYIYASSDKSLSDPDYIGVYQSTNNGVNWVQIGLDFLDISSIIYTKQ